MVRHLFGLLLALLPPAFAQHSHGPAQSGLAVTAVFDDQGRLWRAEVRDGHVWVSRSGDKGMTFGAPVAVNREPETIAADGENRPKIAVAGDHVYVSWTQSLSRPYTGHVRFAHSQDGCRTFLGPVTVNDDPAIVSHRFDSLIVDGWGRVHLFWLDKRDAAAAAARGEAYTGAALYHAVADEALRFGANERLAAHTCECCRVVTALDTDGVPLVFWRHVFGRNVRDHALLRLDGQAKAVRVSFDGWAVDACPHHGPALAVGPDGTRHLAWFSGGPTRQGLFYARMTPSGTLSEPLPFGRNGAQAGHPAVAVLGTRVWLAWKEFEDGRVLIRAMASADGGARFGPARTVATTEGASDHPLLIADTQAVYLSWNTAREGHRLLRLDDSP